MLRSANCTKGGRCPRKVGRHGRFKTKRLATQAAGALKRTRSKPVQAAIADGIIDGSNQRRISFGAGRNGTPVWSPRGDLIAFTNQSGGFHVGVMHTDGSGARILTNGWEDEGPTWAPNGRVIMFGRTVQGGRGSQIWSVDVTGRNERRVPTPGDASDPAWSPLIQ